MNMCNRASGLNSELSKTSGPDFDSDFPYQCLLDDSVIQFDFTRCGRPHLGLRQTKGGRNGFSSEMAWMQGSGMRIRKKTKSNSLFPSQTIFIITGWAFYSRGS